MTMTLADAARLDDGVVTPRADQPKRRMFTAEYKARILDEYDTADRGERGAILRREGLYDSHVQKWRKAVEQGRLRDTPVAGVTPKGRASREAQLAAENAKLRAELDMTKSMLEVMGKAHALLETLSKSAPEKPR